MAKKATGSADTVHVQHNKNRTLLIISIKKQNRSKISDKVFNASVTESAITLLDIDCMQRNMVECDRHIYVGLPQVLAK